MMGSLNYQNYGRCVWNADGMLCELTFQTIEKFKDKRDSDRLINIMMKIVQIARFSFQLEEFRC